MPTYVQLSELKAALSAQAPAGARTAAELDDERLTAALDEAEAEVVGKLATRFAVSPDATLPGLVEGIIMAVAVYLATLEWRQGKDLTPNDPVRLRYARAEANLAQLVAGTLTLEGLVPVAGGAGDAATFDSVPRVNLTDEVHGPTYSGNFPGDWQGGGRAWS